MSESTCERDRARDRARLMAPVPVITVEGFRTWVQDAANCDKARLLTPRHCNGLESVKKRSLAPLRANLLSSETFVRVARSPQCLLSHGHETVAINQLREVHGLPRMSATGCRAQKQQPSRSQHQQRQQETADAGVSTIVCRKEPLPTVNGSSIEHNAENVGRVANLPGRTAHCTVSAPFLQSTPAEYERDAVLATAAGEGSEDPFWLAVVTRRTSADRRNIPVLWLERDARFSAGGEIFWCGQHGHVGTAYVACQVRQYWKPKQIGGWSKDSAFVCSREEVQLVRAHLSAAAAKSADVSDICHITAEAPPVEGSADPPAKRRRRDLSDETKQVSDQPCPLCVANCGKKVGHCGAHRLLKDRNGAAAGNGNSNRQSQLDVLGRCAKVLQVADSPCPRRVANCGKKLGHCGPHRPKPCAGAAGGKGSAKERSTPRSQHEPRSTTSWSATSNGETICTTTRSGRSTAGIARRIFDPSHLGPEGQRPS